MGVDTGLAKRKTTAHLATVNGENGVWGESVKGSLNGNFWVNQLAKSLKLDYEKKQKFKPGAAFSVITRETGKETLVSSF